MDKPVELDVAQTKAVIGGIKVTAPPIAIGTKPTPVVVASASAERR